MWKTKNGETGSGSAFALPCKVKICADSVKVYTGAGYEYVTVGSVSDADNPVITEVKKGKNDILWGNLKSGAGWIPLKDIVINEGEKR